MPKKTPARPAGHAPGSRRLALLDLTALLLMLAVSASLFLTVGPAGLSLVVGTGAGLFATWRTRH
ncbi:hypothetical protein PV411_33155 [Streptomyces sp. NRRL_B-16638]|uniref:hypothetical protein n=1 Tax=Streptomyces TaxID=1883 RepID=UPI000314E9B5|nr:hypothetical protein [Streptomyces sp. NRRL_B-16638]MDX2929358.1 hypothetical protein [Streptomyces sp. NRRL_B-16638]